MLEYAVRNRRTNSVARFQVTELEARRTKSRPSVCNKSINFIQNLRRLNVGFHPECSPL